MLAIVPEAGAAAVALATAARSTDGVAMRLVERPAGGR